MWPIDVLEITTFNSEYSLKLQSGAQRERELIILAWKVKELTELNENGRQLHSDINLLINKMGQDREHSITIKQCPSEVS